MVDLKALRSAVETIPETLGKTGYYDVGAWLENKLLGSNVDPQVTLEADQRALGLGLSGLASQWYGKDPETGEPTFALSPENIGDVRPGVVDELLAIPSLAGEVAPDVSLEAAGRQQELIGSLREQIGVGEPTGFGEHLAESAGVMMGQLPIPAAWLGRLKSIPGEAAGKIEKLGNLAKKIGLAPVEWLSPIIDPKISNYLIGSLFGGTIGALTDEEVEEMTGYATMEDLQEAIEAGDDEAEEFLIQLMIAELEEKAGSFEGEILYEEDLDTRMQDFEGEPPDELYQESLDRQMHNLDGEINNAG